jgi:hypothetical protein
MAILLGPKSRSTFQTYAGDISIYITSPDAQIIGSKSLCKLQANSAIAFVLVLNTVLECIR